MNKKSKSQKNRPDNTAEEWFENRLESSMLDLDALTSMTGKDVQTELKAQGATSSKAFLDGLNAKLPPHASIRSQSTQKSQKRRSTSRQTQKTRKAKQPDRPAARPAVGRASTRPVRIFSIRNAFIISALIIVSAVLIPQFIISFQAADPERAADLSQPADSNGTDSELNSPTSIEGNSLELRLRGVRYTFNVTSQLPTHTPLPPNPGSLSAVYTFSIELDSSGNLLHLEPLQTLSSDLEKSLLDSVLKWEFAPSDSIFPDRIDGRLVIEYFEDQSR